MCCCSCLSVSGFVCQCVSVHVVLLLLLWLFLEVRGCICSKRQSNTPSETLFLEQVFKASSFLVILNKSRFKMEGALAGF